MDCEAELMCFLFPPSVVSRSRGTDHWAAGRISSVQGGEELVRPGGRPAGHA